MQKSAKISLVIGASLKPSRYSNAAIRKLLEYNFPVTAIGLKSGTVKGVEILTGKPELNAIHTVTLYINPKRQPDYYEYVIALKPERVIFNPGTENQEFYDLLRDEGIEVKVGCTLVLLGAQHY